MKIEFLLFSNYTELKIHQNELRSELALSESLRSELALSESAGTWCICRMRSASAVNRTRQVGSVTCARYRYAMPLTNRPLYWFTFQSKVVLEMYLQQSTNKMFYEGAFLIVTLTFSAHKKSYCLSYEQHALLQWFSNLSEVLNPTGVMQAYIEPLIITRSGSRKF